MATIQASAPTSYQLNSLRAFGLEVTKHGNGSYSISETFETEEEAKNYLISRAIEYAENEDELAEMENDIKKYGRLELDAVTAKIV